MTAVPPSGPRTRPCPLTTAVAALDGIGLDTMEQRASLMTRTDRKYLVPLPLVARLVDVLADDLDVLEIGGRRDFAYRSLYYDSPDLAAYHTAATRRRRRFKVRRREYVDAGSAYLEVKTRTGRGDTVKVREQVPTLTGDDLPLPGGAELTGDQLDYAMARLADADVPRPMLPLRPVLETAYRRMTLLVGSEGSRVTIDRALTWRGSALRGHRLEGLVVVETKSASSAGLADRFLWRARYRPQRISKFATGMALLDPALPANRWHRILGQVRRQVHPPCPVAA